MNPAKLSVSYLGASFELADVPGGRTYFLLGVRKSGSSILNSMVNRLTQLNGVNYVDVPGTLFAKGRRVEDWQSDPSFADVVRPGNLYGGFRDAPLGLVGTQALARASKLLMVRDPRDALVSEYFSNAYSHSLPKEGEGRKAMLQHRSQALQSSIDEYVRKRAPALKRTLSEYLPFARMPDVWVVRYEERIMHKRKFLLEICDRWGWTINDVELGHILGWADVLPDEERPTEFVRRVSPGDHVDKLSPSVIEYVTGLLREEMRAFGYVP